MAQPSTTEFPLPVELLTEILRLLPAQDQRTLSLVSRLVRSQSLQFVFGHLRYTRRILPKLRNIHQARKDVKCAIKQLELESRILSIGTDDNRDVIFQFLQSLPNLHTFAYRQLAHLIRLADLARLIASLRHVRLIKFVLDTGYFATVEGAPVVGLGGLETLSISWFISDNPNEPGGSGAHLRELVQPSLTSLVELSIKNKPKDIGPDLDLQVLRAAGDTLKSFEYTLQSADESILDTIPEIFPHLTKLSITWDNVLKGHSLLWKDAHIISLSKNENLTDLELSSDFEENSGDTVTADDDYVWYVRCYTRRLKASQEIAQACTRVQRCSWVQMRIDHKNSSMVHPFAVEERVSDGKVKRVARGVKQFWMGRDHEDEYRGGIVKCTLEDLPGDIIGQNDDH